MLPPDQSPPPPPALTGSEPILAVADVRAAIGFYRDVLGFDSDWTWEDPPTFGGVRLGRLHVMFNLQPELAAKVEGHQHAFFCDAIDELHARHRAANAPIISDIENKPWGLREYTVRDPSGYHLRFGGHPTRDQPATTHAPPDFIRIVHRLPTPREYDALAASVGWPRDPDRDGRALQNSLHGIVALDARQPDADSQIAGALRLVGDGVKAIYVQDVIVRPDLQNKGIGSALMQAAIAHVRQSAGPGAFLGLFTGRHAFYEAFGFRTGYGMALHL